MADAQFKLSTGASLQAAFARSRIVPGDVASDAPPRPIAWTGFGDVVAVLFAVGERRVLERLTLTPALDQVQPWTGRRVLDRDLPNAIVDQLVAPPISARTGVVLVTDTEIRFYGHEDAHLAGQKERERWTARPQDGRIAAATMSQSGDVYVALVEPDQQIAVREASGRLVTRFRAPAPSADGGVGLAAQGRAGNVTLHVWTQDRIAWRSVDGDHEGEVHEAALDRLRAFDRAWRKRVKAGEAMPWFGWRCAASGVYPMHIGGEEQPELVALVVGPEGPRLVQYGLGRYQVAIGDPSQPMLLVDAVGLTAVTPRDGAQIARYEGPVERDAVFSALSNGGFISLAAAGEEIQLRGWGVRDNELLRGCQAVLQAPRDGQGGTVLRPVHELEPLELDHGLGVALEQGAGGSTALRLWCEADAFQGNRA